MTDPSVSRLWMRFRAANPHAPEDLPLSFHFCDTNDAADICADLVVAGRKQATASSLKELELAGLEVAKPGELFIVTDFSGKAKAIIETTRVDIRRFGEIDEDFARAEGEGDLTLEWWRDAHRAYYLRVLSGSGVAVDDDLMIACEYFTTVMTSDDGAFPLQ